MLYYLNTFTKKYDIIVLRHVLEHINGYGECLKQIIESGLKPGGCLFIKIPRMDSWESAFFGKFWSGYDLPRHRVHFSKAGLKKLLSNLGYINIKVKSEVVPNDLMRSTSYYSKHGSYVFLKFFSKVLTVLPGILRTGLSQITGILLSPFGAGRMVIIAYKQQE